MHPNAVHSLLGCSVCVLIRCSCIIIIKILCPPYLRCSAAGTLSVTLQRNMIETLGCDANFGVSCLNKVGQDFAQDREVLQRMGNFQQAAQVRMR